MSNDAEEKLIANDKLQLNDIPPTTSAWAVIARFARTFNADKEHGSREKVAKIANGRRHETLTDLRTCLFFESRRWNHFGRAPEGEDLKYMRSLVEGIRQKVESL